MKHAFYITCFNSPPMLQRLLDSGVMLSVPPSCSIILFDQSTDAAAIAFYKDMASKLGGTHVHNENHGASAAKRGQIKHASKNGFDVMSQVSEDLFYTKHPPASWLPSGPSFINDSLQILAGRNNVKFVNWCMATGGGSVLWDVRCKRSSSLTMRKEPRCHFAHVEGDIYLTGWPYTANVKFANEQVECVIGIGGDQLLHRFPEGGEWILARYSLGFGACLVAQPLVHDRTHELKPAGSRP